MSAVELLRNAADNENYKTEGKVVVVGGGNVAIDVARTSIRCDASSVEMFCLEQRNEMPASEEEIEEALDEGAVINCGWGPKEIITENNKVKAIVFKKCISVKDENNRFNPKYDENDTMTVKCDHVFLSIGQSVMWGSLLDGSKVDLGRGNLATADSHYISDIRAGYFCSDGDVYTGPKFAIEQLQPEKKAQFQFTDLSSHTAVLQLEETEEILLNLIKIIF